MNKPYSFSQLSALIGPLFEALAMLPLQCTLLTPIHIQVSNGKWAANTDLKVLLSLYGHQGRKSKCNEFRSLKSEVRHFPAENRTHLC